MPLVGVDYGSKLAGTTACAVAYAGELRLRCSGKKQDADAWLFDWLSALPPGVLAVDVPLSLPGVYRDLAGCLDYHYRRADGALGAMSPMFLGGLTARGMALAARFRENSWRVVETYPGGLIRELGHGELYRQKRKRDAPG